MKLALGTAQFGMDYGISNARGRVPNAEIKKILRAAKEHIDLLDTARVYGDSEQALGSHEETAYFDIVSKVYISERTNILADVRDSLRVLKKRTMKGILVHNPEKLLEAGGGKAYAQLQSLKHEGYVERIGVSVYDPEILDGLIKHYDFGMIQFPANIFDQRFEKNVSLQRFSENGAILCARSVFLQGVLLMDADRAIEKFPKHAEFLAHYYSLLENCKLTKLQAAISAINHSDLIDYLLVGVTAVSELNQIIQASLYNNVNNLEEVLGFVENVPGELIDPRQW